MALSPKQQRFCDEYLKDLNGTQAATRAGYSPRTAKQQAARLLTNVDVQERIQAAQARRAKRTSLTQDQVLLELARIAFADPRRLMSWGPDGVALLPSAGLSDDVAAAVESVSQTVTPGGGTIKVKCHSKPAALKLLGEHLGVFRPRDPLEVLLGALPPELAAAVRAELGKLLSGGGAGPGGGPPGPEPAPG